MKTTCPCCLILLFAAAFSACKKDKPAKTPDPPVTPTVVNLKKVYQTNLTAGYKSDTIFYIYDTQNKLTRISYIAYKFPAQTNVDFTYSGSHIVSEVFDDGLNYQYTENYHYNAQGQVTYIDHINKYAYLPIGTKVPNTQIEHTDTFTYDANGRITLIDTYYANIGLPPQNVHHKTSYEYDAQGLPAKSVISDSRDTFNSTYVSFTKFTDKIDFDARALSYFLDFNMHPTVLAQLGRLPISMRLYNGNDNVVQAGWEYVFDITQSRPGHVHLTTAPTPNRPFMFDYELRY